MSLVSFFVPPWSKKKKKNTAEGDISENGGVQRNSKILSFHKSNEKTGKNCQNQLFGTLENNQRLAAIHGKPLIK